MLIFLIMTLARVLLLHVRGPGLKSRDVEFIGLHQRLRHGENIRDESIQEIQGHGLADDHTEDLSLVFFWREGII